MQKIIKTQDEQVFNESTWDRVAFGECSGSTYDLFFVATVHNGMALAFAFTFLVRKSYDVRPDACSLSVLILISAIVDIVVWQREKVFHSSCLGVLYEVESRLEVGDDF